MNSQHTPLAHACDPELWSLPLSPSVICLCFYKKKLYLPPDVDDLDRTSGIDDDGKEAEGEG